jgi:hypothetical protein
MDKFVTSQNYICVSGYGWSGSSACVDLLKEFEGFGALQGEFRIAKDPYGLRDLEGSLVHNWDFIRHDVAIRDFLAFCKVLSRETGLFSKVGKNFANKLNIDFMLESKSYINRLTNMTYLGDTFVHRYNIPAYKNFIMKARSKLGKNNAKLMYFARPNEVDFIRETRDYIDSLFVNYMSIEKINTLVLDQAIPPTNIIGTSKYFKNIKIIIVDRDPRDIYVNMIRGRGLLGPELIKRDSVDKYIKWHKQLRRSSVSDRNNIDINKHVLRLNFEDLVLNYNDSILRIKDFLEIDMQHNQKLMHFDPSYSIKNIGLWREYKNQSIMHDIGSELKDYCCNDNRISN